MRKSWFEAFVESFSSGRYVGLAVTLRPWQYKNFMETVKSNKWNMLSQKQIFVFLRNMKTTTTRSTRKEFGIWENDSIKVSLKMSNFTGVVTIDITEK